MLIIGSRVRKHAERLTNTDRLGAALAWCRAHARAEAQAVEGVGLRVVGGRGRPRVRLRGRGRIPFEIRAVKSGRFNAVSHEAMGYRTILRAELPLGAGVSH